MSRKLIDRIGLTLLLEPMTRDDIAMALHEKPADIARELRHLCDCLPRLVCTKDDQLAELRPIYFLTRRGREWAQGAIEKEKA